MPKTIYYLKEPAQDYNIIAWTELVIDSESLTVKYTEALDRLINFYYFEN